MIMKKRKKRWCALSLSLKKEKMESYPHPLTWIDVERLHDEPSRPAECV